jgi:hypothetical protein
MFQGRTIKTDTDMSASLKLSEQVEEVVNTFWHTDKKGILRLKYKTLMDFLSDTGGFYTIKNINYIVVRIVSNIIHETTDREINDFLNEWILDNVTDDATIKTLSETIVRNAHIIFAATTKLSLKKITPNFLASTREKQFLPFKNGIVTISKDGVRIDSYEALNKNIWANQIIDFDITIDQQDSVNECEYLTFLEKISGNDEDRLIYCLSIIGYLLHTYKDPARPYAIILAEETDSEDKGGGSGKGIFVQAISYLLRTVKIDGKLFKVDKAFAMQRVGLDTQLIFIDDCAKNMDFEKHNSQVTEGITVEKKNKPEYHIPFELSPKFVLTTNYTLNIKGNHGKRRTRVFEFAPFFNPDNTPEQQFGHLLFYDWSNDEWNKFYNLMFFCIRHYLVNRLTEMKPSETMKLKRIRVEFGEDFQEYWEELVKEDWLVFKTEYEGFINEYGYSHSDFSRVKFTKALKVAADIFDLKLEKRKNRAMKNQHEFKVCTRCT